MPRHSKLTRSTSIHRACSVTAFPALEFLVPAACVARFQKSSIPQPGYKKQQPLTSSSHQSYESLFFAALARASTCTAHQYLDRSRDNRRSSTQHITNPNYGISRRRAFATHSEVKLGHIKEQERNLQHSEHVSDAGISAVHAARRDQNNLQANTSNNSRARMLRWLDRGHESVNRAANSWFPPAFFNDTSKQRFAESSRLPPDFFGDIDELRDIIPSDTHDDGKSTSQKQIPMPVIDERRIPQLDGKSSALDEQIRLMKSIRELEEKLATAKQQLNHASQVRVQTTTERPLAVVNTPSSQVTLSKEDYMNLVDLYYYSYNSRFSPEATDLSPSPTFLEDHSFTLSSDHSQPDMTQLNEDEHYESPLGHIHDTLRSQKLDEIRVMQVFVNLLLDDASSNRALYDAYKALPQPGVAYLPKGVIRLFLQRMSTPWTHSEKSMLRYLALIDDMQKENLPITSAEWSSAVYLAGRSFARVTDEDVASSFKVWQQMEKEAGVEASHVTFNILFDIAVRSGKFALAQTVLMEMSNRNLRLNRLGRVSLIYYHGHRGDGDGVRKAYRDFVEAGEIVDTLVLNCVIASLLNAKEPNAADQVYERMKSMYSRLRAGVRDDGTDTYYMRYPPPGELTIDREMASNHLGRLLVNASKLQKNLPDHHADLQASMPLVPDFSTFRALISYHTTKSGDLDRMSVLLKDMTEVFQMPLRTLVYQFLFKGFALHGPTGGPDGAWSVKRLDLCWQAFRDTVKYGHSTTSPPNPSETMVLPSITQINAIPINAPLSTNSPLHHLPRRLSGWNEFILDLAGFKADRLRRIESFHAQMPTLQNKSNPQNLETKEPFFSPFFQSTIHDDLEPEAPHEGEYILPSPTITATTIAYDQSKYDRNTDDTSRSFHDEEDASDLNVHARQPYDRGKSAAAVSPSRPLVCWLLRAYARNTKSRARVEEIWGAIRKMWQPRDQMERENVVRVLRRCLQDCDREGRG